MCDVLVLEHNEDISEAMVEILSAVGFSVEQTVIRDKPVDDVTAFIKKCDPKVVIYDMGAPPYEKGVERWEHLCERSECMGRKFIVTSTNAKSNIHSTGGCDLRYIIVKPHTNDLIDIVQAALA